MSHITTHVWYCFFLWLQNFQYYQILISYHLKHAVSKRYLYCHTVQPSTSLLFCPSVSLSFFMDVMKLKDGKMRRLPRLLSRIPEYPIHSPSHLALQVKLFSNLLDHVKTNAELEPHVRIFIHFKMSAGIADVWDIFIYNETGWSRPSISRRLIHKHWIYMNSQAISLNATSLYVYANMWHSSISVHRVFHVTNEQQQELPALHASFRAPLPNSIRSAQG